MDDSLKAIRKRILDLKDSLDLSYQDLSDRTGLSKSTIQRYVTGDIGNLGLDKLEILADALEVSPGYLMGWEDNNEDLIKIENLLSIPKTGKKIPLLGTIAAGTPILANENVEEYFSLEDTIKADFCLRVQGDSMINAGINSGDIVFIKQQPVVEDGEVAAVLIDDSATLKRVYKFGDHVQLRAENPNYKPIDLNDNDDVLILGKATYKISSVK